MVVPDKPYDAVVFDLLTALLDSWTLWNTVSGSAETGLAWRGKYLELTYQAGPYRPYEDIIHEAAAACGIAAIMADVLIDRWNEIPPWPEVPEILPALADRVPLGIATNSSNALARIAVGGLGVSFAAMVTAEEAGFYKPRPQPYQMVLDQLGIPASRVLFVAGSAADVPGASGVGMPVFWHNRRRLKPVDQTIKPLKEADSLLPLLDLVKRR